MISESKRKIKQIEAKIKSMSLLSFLLVIILIACLVLLIIFNSRALYYLFSFLEALCVTLIFAIILFYFRGVYFPFKRLKELYTIRKNDEKIVTVDVQIIKINDSLTSKMGTFFKEILVKENEKEYYLYLSEYSSFNLEINKNYNLLIKDNFILEVENENI